MATFPSATAAIWPTRLRAFTGGDQEVFNCPSHDERCRWVKGAPPDAAGVATAAQAPFGYEIGEPILEISTRFFSYGYNVCGTMQDAESDRGLGSYVNLIEHFGRPPPRELKASRVRKPAEMIAIGDSAGDGSWDLLLTAALAGGMPGKVHGGMSNILFCDGHVQPYRPDDLVLPKSGSSTPEGAARWVEIARLWNNDNTGPGGD